MPGTSRCSKLSLERQADLGSFHVGILCGSESLVFGLSDSAVKDNTLFQDSSQTQRKNTVLLGSQAIGSRDCN